MVFFCFFLFVFVFSFKLRYAAQEPYMDHAHMKTKYCWAFGQTQVLKIKLRTNKQTLTVGPFGNNLQAGCSLTRNSYGVPQNQVSASKRGILLYLKHRLFIQYRTSTFT